MKKIIIYITGNLMLLLPLLLVSCSDKVDVNFAIPEKQEYVSIYLPQAYEILQKKNVYVSDEVQSFVVSAHYGGPDPAPQDIKVSLIINKELVNSFNREQETDYQLMPEGSYQLETTDTYIKSGAFSSEPVKINITSEGYMDVGKSYLLPVSIRSVDSETRINEKLRDAYFLITGSFKPGSVPREKTYSFGTTDVGILFCKNNDLIQLDASGNLLLLQPDENDVFEISRQIGWGWGGVSIMFYMSENRFLARKPDSNIEQYYINDDYNFLSQRTIGWGWGDAVTIFPFKDIIVFNTSPEGAITKFPLSQSGDWDYGQIAQVGTGFDIYTQIFDYENTIIGIDVAGIMWEYPVSDAGLLGNKRQIGTGWDMYVKVIRCGADLLALDGNGDLWRYRFDPNGFWPLK
jgi:hypothetical protein